MSTHGEAIDELPPVAWRKIRSNTKLITHNGLSLSLRDWASRLGTECQTIRYRLRAGWSEAEAVTIPIGKSRVDIATRTEKTCSACRVSKPLVEFYLRSSRKDRRASNCKLCSNSRAPGPRLTRAEDVPASAVRLFWAKVDRSSDCWMWTGLKDRLGYGQTSARGRHYGAARFVWMLTHGTWPELFVCHRCDNPPCVRPDHLFLGTHADNMADMCAKGRSATGERSGKSKLLERDILVIRQRVAAGESYAALAREFGVGPTAIQSVASGRTWRHVCDQ